ncbi:VCBS repeat-containing protein [uncultured Croceitalea sp.]|uniref:VCBS repeat-containing protein n=1 Tax=uncultured Croceitalea sp. TaxID=1798908 RepID=UPI003306832E
MIRYAVLFLIGLAFVSCKKNGALFHNPTAAQTGLDFENKLTETDDLNILDYLYFYNGGGVAVGDVNNDGLPDVFFSGNQVKNRLYINNGDMTFKDVTDSAGVGGNSTWNTGTVMGDVNGDGLLDIYVCAVVGINGFNGFNELFINNGDGTFTESAAKYGLDFDSYSSSAAFLDFDLDGDLDMYLLNHAVHTENSFGKANLRYSRDYQTGDKLLRNDGGRFTDVSEEAGIYGGINGYGLGLAVADFNMDGYPDIYVGNDFHEDDYYYLNNGNGTFTESLKKHFGHISRFSMGNDVADINRDGLPDLISLDMLPEDEIPLKASEGDENVQIQKIKTKKYGYHYQFTRNMLFVNQPDGMFIETALMSNVAATDWSWSALFGDYNQDGEQDLFISNGIPKRPNDLDFIKFVSSDQIKNKINNTKLVDQRALKLMPSGAVSNYVFKGKKGLAFKDMSSTWIANDTLISGATAYADFDNDGDLDLITNNINQTATLYQNQTNQSANYLKLQFNYLEKNKFGIGTKVYAYNSGELQYKELSPSRGFQASSEPIVHFGFGKTKTIDSLKIIWPNKTYQVLRDVTANQTLVLKPSNTLPYQYDTFETLESIHFDKVTNNLGIDFLHIEDNYTDFNREKLIPYQVSDRGPALAIGDLNGDGKDDIFFGGSKFVPSKIYLQTDSTFVRSKFTSILNDSIKEEVAAVVQDFNGDSKNDLFIASGGNDFFGNASPLSDSYFVQADSSFIKKVLPDYFQNASVIKPYDYDGDGDLDVFIAGHTITNQFGKPATSYLLKNDAGEFSIAKEFDGDSIGMVTDVLWDDFNADGTKDLILVGEWMSPKFFKNLNGSFTEVSNLTENISGLWQAIEAFDIDKDGDMDYLLGNWGLNSKFQASKERPLKLFFGDFDKNGQTETLTAIEKGGVYYTIEGLDDLSSQLVFLRKKFNSYTKFAGMGIKKVIDEKMLDDSKVLDVVELQSGYLKNENGRFTFVPFQSELQLAPLLAFLPYDFDNDNQVEVLIGGNFFGVKPYHGRFDSFPGALLKNENDVILGNRIGLDLTQKSIRHLSIINSGNKPYLLVTFNNEKAQIYEFESKQ